MINPYSKCSLLCYVLDNYKKAIWFTPWDKHFLSRENLSYLAQKCHWESGKWRSTPGSNTMIWSQVSLLNRIMPWTEDWALRTAPTPLNICGKEPGRWDEEKTINFLLRENWAGHFGLKALERKRNRRLFLEKYWNLNWNLNESLIQNWHPNSPN